MSPRGTSAFLAFFGLTVAALGLGACSGASEPPAPFSARTAAGAATDWPPGAALDTTSEATAHLPAGGRVTATQGAQLRRLDGNHAALALDEGQAQFSAEATLALTLPGATLTCEQASFTAAIDALGHGVIDVKAGEVTLVGSGGTTRLFAAMTASTWADGRVGLPVAAGASPALLRSVDAFDQRVGDLGAVLASAQRPEDALTVWHLLARVRPSERPFAAARLRELVLSGLPASQPLIKLDADALDVAFDAARQAHRAPR